MTDPSPGQSMPSRQLLLRGFVLLSALAGTIFYLGIWRWWWLIPANRRDGFELIGPVLGTIYFALFVVPCWYFGIRNYALWIAAVLAVFALFFATDGAFSWFPWQFFGGN